MTRKPIVFLSALALATLGLAACGGDTEGSGEETTSSPAAASEDASQDESSEAPQQEGSTSETPSDEYAETSPEEETDQDEAEGAADAEPGAADPGPGAEGAVIPAAAETDPPQTVGEYTMMEGSGPAHIYSDEDSSVMISLDSTVLSSPYESLAGSIETDNQPAGTGSCGTDESGSSITCYQRSESGVITLTAVPEEISIDQMVVFVNQYAEAAGAARR